MSDRGSCKVFSPNIFNPTKCQNCYKPKEGHPSGPVTQAGNKIQRGLSLPVARERVRNHLKFEIAFCLIYYTTIRCKLRCLKISWRGNTTHLPLNPLLRVVFMLGKVLYFSKDVLRKLVCSYKPWSY